MLLRLLLCCGRIIPLARATCCVLLLLDVFEVLFELLVPVWVSTQGKTHMISYSLSAGALMLWSLLTPGRGCQHPRGTLADCLPTLSRAAGSSEGWSQSGPLAVCQTSWLLGGVVMGF